MKTKKILSVVLSLLLAAMCLVPAAAENEPVEFELTLTIKTTTATTNVGSRNSVTLYCGETALGTQTIDKSFFTTKNETVTYTFTLTECPDRLEFKIQHTKVAEEWKGRWTAVVGGMMVTASSQVPVANATCYARWTPRLGLAAASEWPGEFTTDSWCGQGAVAHDGNDALRSGIIYDGQSSYLITKVTGAGTLTFWWAVSCEAGGKDALRLLVDGSQIDMISGEVDWTKVAVEIPGEGTHTIKWNYTKNGSVTKGEDFGWIDQMSWVGR